MAVEYSSPTRSRRGSPSRLSISNSQPHSPTRAQGGTNTLALTPVCKPFFQPAILSALKEHFELYGPLVYWVPLPSFGRVIVVYENEEDAERAKVVSDPILLAGTDDRPETTLRVYRADPTPINDVAGSTVAGGRFLLPPSIDKNFLISPPGSPPVGWEPIKEDPPNSSPLADDLIAALKQLQIHQRVIQDADGSATRTKRGSREVILEPDESIGVGVYVENCDDDEDEDSKGARDDMWVYGESFGERNTVWKPIPTAMPPVQAVS